MHNPFQSGVANIEENSSIRTPQREAFQKLTEYACDNTKQDLEVGIVLPVGCGKSGCITLAPFAFKSNRTLVVAPGVHIATQLVNDFDPTNSQMFYQKWIMHTSFLSIHYT